jgi:hypothetical protein
MMKLTVALRNFAKALVKCTCGFNGGDKTGPLLVEIFLWLFCLFNGHGLGIALRNKNDLQGGVVSPTLNPETGRPGFYIRVHYPRDMLCLVSVALLVVTLLLACPSDLWW